MDLTGQSKQKHALFALCKQRATPWSRPAEVRSRSNAGPRSSVIMAPLCSFIVLLMAGRTDRLEDRRRRHVPGRERGVRRPVSRVLSPRARGMAIHLGRPLPDASRDPPGRRRGNPPAGRTRGRPYSVLLPVGFTLPPPLPARGALLPHPFTLTGRPCGGRAVCFLWHFPWGRPRRALPGTVFPWSPDFPPPVRSRGAAIRPPDRIQGGAAGAAGQRISSATAVSRPIRRARRCQSNSSPGSCLRIGATSEWPTTR